MKHVHRYQRVNISQTKGKEYLVLKCSLPDCSHYIIPKLALGKKSICWRCGETFIITADLLRLVKPHCKDCTKTDTKIKINDNLLEQFLKDLV